MSPRRPMVRHSRRFARRALTLALAACVASTHAGAATPADAEDAYDPFAAFDPPPQSTGAETYRDRIIAPESLEPLPDDDDDDSSAGPRRALHVEAIAHRSRFGGEDTLEFGAAFGGYWDTADLGTLSLDALAFRVDRDRAAYGRDDGARWRGTATLWQRGLDLPGGWRVDNGLGVLNTPMPALLRDQYRFLLPSVPMLGASSEWRQRARGLSLHGAVGRGGVYSGARLSGFESGDGAVGTVGAEWRWNAQWSGAATLLATDGRIVPDRQGLPAFQNVATRALLIGQRWQGARDQITLNLQASDGDGDIGGATGAWLDGRSARGAYVHRYGLFNLQPDLAWGAWPIANDARGGYYRVDYQRARWSWNVGIDRIGSISGDGFDGWYGSAHARYQSSPRLSYGGNLSARRGRGDADAEALQAFVDLRTRGGDTRLQFDAAQDASGGDSWQVLADHALRLREGWRLSLSAGVGELANGGFRPARTTTLAAYGGFDIGTDLTIDGTARWTRSDGDAGARGLDLSLGWRWRIAPRWSLLGNLSENRGSRRSPFALDPLTNQPVFETLPHDRSLQISLRYDHAAGRAAQVLGGAPDAATGRVAGSIFLDDNDDGVRNAAERPVAGITLVLDGRYTLRTDDQGRFAFDRVAVGTHTLEVLADNLPLPWSLDPAQARRSVQVEVRDRNEIEIPAQRPR